MGWEIFLGILGKAERLFLSGRKQVKTIILSRHEKRKSNKDLCKHRKSKIHYIFKSTAHLKTRQIDTISSVCSLFQ